MCQPSFSNSRRDAVEYVARGEIDQPLEKVETHTTDAGRVHPFQLAVGHLIADEGNALGAPFGGFERIDHRPVVLAVAGRLNNHVLVEAKKIAQREQFLLWCVTGCVFAFRRVRKLVLGAEHMAMRVDRTRRRFKVRLGRMRIERNVTGTHRHVKCLLIENK